MKYLAACLLLSTATALSQPADENWLYVHDSFRAAMLDYGLAAYEEGGGNALLALAEIDPEGFSGDTKGFEDKVVELKAAAALSMAHAYTLAARPLSSQRVKGAGWDESTRTHSVLLYEDAARSRSRAAKYFLQVIEIIKNYHR